MSSAMSEITGSDGVCQEVDANLARTPGLVNGGSNIHRTLSGYSTELHWASGINSRQK